MLINFTQDRSLKNLPRKDGSTITVPDFVNQARNRYFYDDEEEVMLKECLDCQRKFVVAIPAENGEWEKFDNEIHSVKSGFRERCKECLQKRKEENASGGDNQGK